MRLPSTAFWFSPEVRYALAFTARCAANRCPFFSLGSNWPTITARELGSCNKRSATPSRAPLAALSTRALFSLKKISVSLLACGFSGGASTFTVELACTLRPRSSVQVAPTLIAPGAAPAVSSVAVLPLPVAFPALAVQLLTLTCRPSVLVHSQVTVADSPERTVVGFAEHDILGAFRGGSFTVNAVVASAFCLPSLARTVTLYLPGARPVVSIVVVASLPAGLPPEAFQV